MSTSSDLHRLRAGTTALLLVLAVAGCSSNTAPPGTGPSASAPSGTGSAPAITTTVATIAPPSPTGALADLRTEFDSLAKTLPGQIALAVVPLGSDANATVLGDMPAGFLPAWSTIKVPLAIAAQRHGGGNVTGPAKLAIEESDNAAADQLWSSLGTPAQAKQAVEAVLHDGKDATAVQDEQVYPPYSPFGQTDWQIAAQAQFAAHLPCLPDSAKVLDLMRNVGGVQQWGLALLDGAASKGGWGPAKTTGSYLVRQFAIVPTKTGSVAIAVAAKPSSGSFGSGTAMLDKVGQWLQSHLDQLPAGHCTGPSGVPPAPTSGHNR